MAETTLLQIRHRFRRIQQRLAARLAFGEHFRFTDTDQRLNGRIVAQLRRLKKMYASLSLDHEHP